jgi:hypothetical protein
VQPFAELLGIVDDEASVDAEDVEQVFFPAARPAQREIARLRGAVGGGRREAELAQGQRALEPAAVGIAVQFGRTGGVDTWDGGTLREDQPIVCGKKRNATGNCRALIFART